MRLQPLILSVIAFAVVGVTADAGIVTGSHMWDGSESTQRGRIVRDGEGGARANAWPGTFGTGTHRYFVFHFVNAGGTTSVSVSESSNSATWHLAAYSGSTYDPNHANNAGAYLGDQGNSLIADWAFLAAANASFIVVASANFDHLLGTETVEFTLEGENIFAGDEVFTRDELLGRDEATEEDDELGDDAADAIPEPASLALLLAGGAVVGLVRRRRRSA